MARNTLLADLEIPVVSLEDVYGGKLVAAMDRQSLLGSRWPNPKTPSPPSSSPW